MFIVGLSAVLGLMQLVPLETAGQGHDPAGTHEGILTAVLIALATLLVATLIRPRVFELTEVAWFAWPGYFWFALVVYLF